MLLSCPRQSSWISGDLLANFILRCQDASGGGISDRPGNMADIFHTFFGIAGLSLLNYFENAFGGANAGDGPTSILTGDALLGFHSPPSSEVDVEARGPLVGTYVWWRRIDATYALPKYLVDQLHLSSQVLEEGVV